MNTRCTAEEIGCSQTLGVMAELVHPTGLLPARLHNLTLSAADSNLPSPENQAVFLTVCICAESTARRRSDFQGHHADRALYWRSLGRDALTDSLSAQ